MGVPRTIVIGDGVYGKREYHYYEEFDSWDEAVEFAKELKMEHKEIKLKYFILESKDSWFLPVPKFVVYTSRRMRL